MRILGRHAKNAVYPQPACETTARPQTAAAHRLRLHVLDPRTAGDESAAARQLRRLWPPPLPSSRRDDQQQPTAASRPTT